jgi:putative ABC transport system permease protein
VALISESVARRYYADMDPIGQPLSRLPLSNEDSDRSSTIIGVVADTLLHRVHTEHFGVIHLTMDRTETPSARGAMSPPTLIVRTAAPAAAARAIEDALRKLDNRVRPATWIVSESVNAFVNDKRMLAWMAGPMAGLALILSALGVYGVTAFVASRRTQEVSVRMALGASSTDVLRLLVNDGLRPVIIGLSVGLLVALGAGRLFASVLTGVSPYDPVAIAISTAVLMGAALIAVMIPARRAAQVDPAAILRES